MREKHGVSRFLSLQILEGMVSSSVMKGLLPALTSIILGYWLIHGREVLGTWRPVKL